MISPWEATHWLRAATTMTPPAPTLFDVDSLRRKSGVIEAGSSARGAPAVPVLSVVRLDRDLEGLGVGVARRLSGRDR